MVMRSGLTTWDTLGRVQGATDLPLSDDGLAGVRADLEKLAPTSLGLIIAAPDEASRQTARLLAERTEARLEVVPELREMELGLWEGLRYEELESRFCRAGRKFLEDPTGVCAPEGERLSDYAQRVVPEVGKVLSRAVARVRSGVEVAIVLRPIALGLVRCALEGRGACEVWEMVTDRPNLEWHSVERDDPRLTRGVRMTSEPEPTSGSGRRAGAQAVR